MNVLSAIGGGLAGATSLTILHELTRRMDKDAPRMDLMGMEALSKGLQKTGQHIPSNENLYRFTLVGDIISNTLYYSLAASGNRKYVVPKGTALGLVAGLGALLLPQKLGLTRANSNRTFKTQLLTTGFYMLGGLIASFVARRIEKKTQVHERGPLWV